MGAEGLRDIKSLASTIAAWTIGFFATR